MDQIAHHFSWIEPATFFISLSYGLSETGALTDNILKKTCQNEFGENSSDCSSSLNSLISIQSHATTILSLKAFIENIITAFVCIFLGLASDKFGRKPIFLIAATGSLIYHFSLALLSNFNADVYWYLIPSITSILGGFPMIIVASYCYTLDIENDETKFYRMHFVDVTIFAGKLAGCLAYPAIVKQFSHWVTFTIAASSCLLALLYTCIFFKESHINEPSDDGIVTKIRQFPERITAKLTDLIWLTLFIVALHDDNIQGTSTTLYLFTQQFQWSLSEFSIYLAAQYAIMLLGLILLSSRFVSLHLIGAKVSVVAIGILSNLGCALTRVFAKQSWHIYLASSIGAFNWIPAYSFRRTLMNDIPKEDIGMILGTAVAIERLALSLIAPLNIYLCIEFLTNYPHPVWFVHVSLYVIAILTFCGLIVGFCVSMARDEE